MRAAQIRLAATLPASKSEFVRKFLIEGEKDPTNRLFSCGDAARSIRLQSEGLRALRHLFKLFRQSTRRWMGPLFHTRIPEALSSSKIRQNLSAGKVDFFNMKI